MAIHFIPRKNSFRLKDYDYGSCGKYFITILVKHHSFRITKIAKEESNYVSIPFDTGKIIEKVWESIPEKFNKVAIDKSIIMPDHFHGIIHILSPSEIILKSGGGITGQKNPMLYEHSLGKIIRWFKAKAAFEIRRISDPTFKWQRNYHDSILWNEKSLIATRKYILKNPKNWMEQKDT
jgi:putative transposase